MKYRRTDRRVTWEETLMRLRSSCIVHVEDDVYFLFDYFDDNYVFGRNVEDATTVIYTKDDCACYFAEPVEEEKLSKFSDAYPSDRPVCPDSCEDSKLLAGSSDKPTSTQPDPIPVDWENDDLLYKCITREGVKDWLRIVSVSVDQVGSKYYKAENRLGETYEVWEGQEGWIYWSNQGLNKTNQDSKLIPVDWENDEVVGKRVFVDEGMGIKRKRMFATVGAVSEHERDGDFFADLNTEGRGILPGWPVSQLGPWFYAPGEVPVKKRAVECKVNEEPLDTKKKVTFTCPLCFVTSVKPLFPEHDCLNIRRSKKLFAPALYVSEHEYVWRVSAALFVSEHHAKGFLKDYIADLKQVIWPALPNKDGFYEVPEEE